MLVARQRKKECMLVTIAALADRPYPEVRAYARRIMGKPWSSHWGRKASTRSPISFRSAVLDVAGEFGGPGLVALVDSDSDDRSGIAPIAALPLKGRGIVRFRCLGRQTGHIAPWCDGLIYDTDGAAPRTLAEYLARYSRTRVDYVRNLTLGSPEDNPTPSPDMGY